MNKFLKKNSSTILTVIGSIGVGITAVMSARDTVRAMRRIEREYMVMSDGNAYFIDKVPLKRKIKVAAPCYIPTIITGVSTILCVCGANKLNKNMQKSLTSAYMLLDRSYKEYRNSVKEIYGEDGDLSVAKNIADKKSEELIPFKQPDTDLFFDFFGLRFFESNLSKIHEAEKAANEIMKSHGYISLSDIHYLMGADSTDCDESLGWSVGAGKLYGYDQIKIDIQETIGKDGNKYYVLDFMDSPTEDYMNI